MQKAKRKVRLGTRAGRVLAGILVAVMLAGVAPYALADYNANVPESEELEIYFHGGAASYPVLRYTRANLQAMEQVEEEYSSVDAMPARVYTFAKGVSIDTLLTEMSTELRDEGHTVDLHGDCYAIGFGSSDDWYRAYLYDELFMARYYYPDLYNAASFGSKVGGGWTVNANEVLGGGTYVQPMLALESWQDRITRPDEANPFHALSTKGSFRFCIGQTENDIASGISTTSHFGQGIIKLDIYLDASSFVYYGPPEVGVAVSPESASIAVGEKLRLYGEVVPSDANSQGLSWSSDNKSVATVTQSGEVTGVSPGVAVITVSGSRYSAECRVTVLTEDQKKAEDSKAGSDSDAVITGVELKHEKLAMIAGARFSLKAQLISEGTPEAGLIWESDDESIATVDADGNITAVGKGTVKIRVRTPDGEFSAECTITVSAPLKVEFSDIEDSDAKDNIALLAGRGLIKGYGDGTFRPDASLTRAEFITILMRFLRESGDVEEGDDAEFPDIEGHWAEDDIALAAALGIIGGFEDGSFRPDGTVSYEQIAVILAKLYGIEPRDDADEDEDTPQRFGSGDVAGWARDSVNALTDAGILSADTENSALPGENATRGDIATIIVRICEHLRGE